MYKTKNTISEKTRNQIGGMLQEHLSNSIDLFTQSKQAHWNVKGPDFIALHELFDKIAINASNFSDLIAERIVQLGGVAEGTLRQAAKKTSLLEFPLDLSTGHQHVEALARSLANYGESVRLAINNADELEDRATADIMTEISREVDKDLWFVEAHIQSDR